MVNLIVGAIIIAIIAGAITKIISEKKKGTKCASCPYSQGGSCSRVATPKNAEKKS